MKKLVLFLCLFLGLSAGAEAASTPWPMGVFPNSTANVSGSDAEMSLVYSGFHFPGASSGGVGSVPPIQLVFLDGTATPNANGSGWYGNYSIDMSGCLSHGPTGGGCSNSYNLSTFTADPDWAASLGIVPLIEMPMYADGTGGTNQVADQATLFNSYISGAYDAEMKEMVDVWVGAGYKHLMFRPGVEFNLYSYQYNSNGPCYGQSDCSTQLYLEAFDDIANALHSECAKDGATCQVIWNPGLMEDNPAALGQFPGKPYVDVIGGDLYPYYGYSVTTPNPTPNSLYDWQANGEKYSAPNSSYVTDANVQAWYNTVNYEHWLDYPYANAFCADASGPGGSCVTPGQGTGWSLRNMITFAQTQGLPIGLPETGAGGNGDGPLVSVSGCPTTSGNNYTTDDNVFPTWLAATLRSAASANGVGVAEVSIYDNNGAGPVYEFLNGCKPNEAAAWEAGFGTTAAGIGTPSSAANTQVNGPIGQINDTNNDAWTISTTGQLDENGSPIASSPTNMYVLFWTGTALDYETLAGQWYNQPLNGGTPTSISAPTGYVAPHATSAAGTEVTNTSQTIYDTYGNAWTLTPNQQIAVNGVLVSSSALVTTLYWTGSQLDQLNTEPQWYTQPLNAQPGVGIAAPAGYGVTAIGVSLTVQSIGTKDYIFANPFVGASIMDSNSGTQNEAAIITMSSTTANSGTLSDPNSSGDGSTISGTGNAQTITIPATSAANLQNDIDGIVFTPTPNQVGVGSSVVTTFTVTVTDTAAQTTTATSTVTATHYSPAFSGNKGC